MDAATTLGPLCAKNALERLAKQVGDAVEQGGSLMFGGKPADREGYSTSPRSSPA